MHYELSTDDSSAGVAYEINHVLHLWSHIDGFTYLLQRLGNTEVAVVDDAIGIVDVADEFGWEIATTQTYEVDAAIGYRLASSNHKRRNVHTGTSTTLNHRISTNAAELMYQYGCADDGVIVFNSVVAPKVTIDSQKLWDEACKELGLQQASPLHIHLNDHHPITILKCSR